MKTINVGKDFSENPAGRTIELDGEDSGEAFREKVLKPMLDSLESEEQLQIVLDDGVISYGSSFISEAFGGMVRNGYMPANELLEKLIFIYDSKYMGFVANKIKSSIEENAARYQSVLSES